MIIKVTSEEQSRTNGCLHFIGDQHRWICISFINVVNISFSMWLTFIPGKLWHKRSGRTREWSLWKLLIGGSAILNFLMRPFSESKKHHCEWSQTWTVTTVLFCEPGPSSFLCNLWTKRETQKPQKTPPVHGNEVVWLVWWLVMSEQPTRRNS